MLQTKQFERFRKALEALPFKDRYERDELICEKYLLFSEGRLNAYYAPFHYLNGNARVILVGLTPGWTQMHNAFRAAKYGMAHGFEADRLFQFIDRSGSFSGSMRPILVGMLDGIGLHDCLQIGSCDELFREGSDLVHFTSVISAPIFKNGENYSASSARQLLGLKSFKLFILENLADELKALPDAMIVPLGKVAGEVIAFLNKEKKTSGDRSLVGFPHPSGANGHRPKLFAEGQARWRKQVRKFFPVNTLRF